MAPPWEIQVANPSPYPRDDYVEVDLDWLGVPRHLDQHSLSLFRLGPAGLKTGEDLPFQIDKPFGDANRVLVFFSKATPAGPDDSYRTPSARFSLEERNVRRPEGPGFAAK